MKNKSMVHIHTLQLENKNQFVITYLNNKNEKIYLFQSYDSVICVYNTITQLLEIGSKWDYSKTTLKHFKMFINCYTCYNYTDKKQFEHLLYFGKNENIILCDFE